MEVEMAKVEPINIFIEIGENVKSVLNEVAKFSGAEAGASLERIIETAVKQKQREFIQGSEFVQGELVANGINSIPEKIEVTFKIPTIYVHHVGLK
jgi:hypothetical protein